MMLSTNSSGASRRVMIGAAVLMVALVLLCYGDTFSDFFTAPDTLSLIDTGRVGSPMDVVRILTEPLMNGTQFAEGLRFFRPVSVFSYSIDHALWGLNPVGYHITNLLIHVLVSLLLFALVRKLTGSLAAALVSGVIFCIHPVHVENIPAIARRHDALAMMFLLATLVTLPASKPEATGKRRILALVLFALALGSKESALIAPAVVTVYMACWFGGNAAPRAGRALVASLPYWILTALFFVWRFLVVGGAGGDLRSARAPYSESTPRILGEFFRGFVDPYGVFGTEAGLIVLVVAAVALLVWMARATTDARKFADQRMNPMAYLVFLTWLVGALGLFLAASAFEIRHLYMPLVPFSAIVGISLVVGVSRFVLIRGVPVLLRATDFVTIVLVGLVLGLLIGMSPAVRTYPDWKAIGRMSSMFLDELTHAAPGFSAGRSVSIDALPWRVGKYVRSKVHVRTAGGLLGYSIQSWMDMKIPDSGVRYTLNWVQVPEMEPEYLFLVPEPESGTRTRLRVSMVFAEPDENPESFLLTGRSYRATAEDECAAYYLSRYLDHKPGDADAWATLAYSYSLTGNERKAEEMWLYVLEMNAYDAVALRGLTIMYRSQKALSKASRMGARWIEAEPENAEAYQTTGWITFSRGRRTPAIELFEEALSLQQSTPSHRGLVMSYFAGKRYEEAVSKIEAWLDYDRQSDEAYELAAKCFRELGRDSDLIAMAELARTHNAVTIQTADIVANAYIRAARVPDAEEILRNVSEANPDSSFVRSRVAELNARLGECDTARRWLAEAVKLGLDPDRARVVRKWIQTCEDRKERRERNR